MEERRETPQERWQKKAGYITKGFKMYRSLADRFAKACEKEGKTQAAVIAELMEEYIKKTE